MDIGSFLPYNWFCTILAAVFLLFFMLCVVVVTLEKNKKQPRCEGHSSGKPRGWKYSKLDRRDKPTFYFCIFLDTLIYLYDKQDIMANEDTTIAENQCPVCDGKLQARGLSWRCLTCGRSFARAYKKDPSGQYIPRTYGMWILRVHYRMDRGLPFEKGYKHIPEKIYYHYERSKQDLLIPHGIVLCSHTEWNGSGRETFLVTSPFSTKEECMAQLKEYLAAQEELAEGVSLVEDASPLWNDVRV